MPLLKDDTELLAGGLANEPAVSIAPRSTPLMREAAAVFNRCGALLNRLAKSAGIDLACPIAVWVVQSGGRPFLARRAALRFEVQQLYAVWGNRVRHEFDDYFRFGGHNLQTGHSWENHEFRSDPDGGFRAVHHNQNTEYAALTMARMLAGDADGLNCASLGGPLLPVDAHEVLGYRTGAEMFVAFQKSERTQILGFFDYCNVLPAPKAGDLMKQLRAHDWHLFAKHFQESNRSPIDAEQLVAAHTAATKVIREFK
jgi:N-acetylmuramidase